MHAALDLTPSNNKHQTTEHQTETFQWRNLQLYNHRSGSVTMLSLCFYPLSPVCPLPSEPHAKAHCNRNENYSSADLQTQTTLGYLATPHACFHWSRWGIWGENRTDGRKREKWSPSRQCLWRWSRNLRRNPSTLDQVQAAADLQNCSNEFAYEATLLY